MAPAGRTDDPEPAGAGGGAGAEAATRKALNRAIGLLGEQAAAEYLWRRGYRILKRNYRCPAGEIDIIAEERGVLAFVEVKTRSPRAYAPPADAVDEEKRDRIRAAARYYLGSYREPSPRRFDVVSVLLDESDRVVSIEVEAGAFAE